MLSPLLSPSPLLLAILSLLLLVTLAAASPACPVVLSRAVTPRIIGGHPAPLVDAAHLLRLTSPPSENSSLRVCTASLISATHALTAAHCAVAPGWLATTTTGVPLRVAAAWPHHRYLPERNRAFDIAVLLLDPAVPDLPRLPLNDATAVPAAFAYVRVQGVGLGPPAQVDIPEVPGAQCGKLYAKLNQKVDPRRQICAGYVEVGGCDSCRGDSGGPLLQYDASGQPVLVALVSAAAGCAEPGFPGINIRVAPLLDWVRARVPDVVVNSDAVQVVLPGDPGRPPAALPPPPPPSPPSPPSPSSSPKPSTIEAVPSKRPSSAPSKAPSREPPSPRPARPSASKSPRTTRPTQRPRPSERASATPVGAVASGPETAAASGTATQSVESSVVAEYSVTPRVSRVATSSESAKVSASASGSGMGLVDVSEPSASAVAQASQLPEEGEMVDVVEAVDSSEGPSESSEANGTDVFDLAGTAETGGGNTLAWAVGGGLGAAVVAVGGVFIGMRLL